MSTSTPPPSSSTSSSSSLLARAQRLFAHYLPQFHASLHGFFLLNVLIYVVPLGHYSHDAFFRGLKVSAIACALHLYRKYGKPQLAIDYGYKLIADSQGQWLLLLLMLHSTVEVPVLMFLLPFAVRSTLFLAKYLARTMPQSAPALNAKYGDRLRSTISRDTEFHQQNALIEVMTGMLLIFNAIFTSHKQLMLVLMYWQYLRLRATMDAKYTRQAFATVKSTVDGLLAKPFVPTALRGVWRTVCDFVEKQAPTQEEQARRQREAGQSSGASSLLSKCSIM